MVSEPASSSDLKRARQEESPAGKSAGLFFGLRKRCVWLFASYPVAVSIKVLAITTLTAKYRCWPGGSGCSAIWIIVPCTRWTSRLRRGGATAMTVSAAIFAIVMATVGRRPASMRCRLVNGDYRDCQYQDYIAVNGHPENIVRKSQISVKLISRNSHHQDFEAKHG